MSQGFPSKDLQPVDRWTEADFSEAHPWGIDETGAHEHFSQSSGDDYAPVYEMFQNGFDAADYGIPNNVIALLDKSGDPRNPFLTVIDCGPEGICKDYGGDIQEFIAAKKGTSNKVVRNMKRKGLGMLQYANLGSKIIITSMDKDFIHKIPIFRHEKKNCYGKIWTKPTKDPYFNEFKIWQKGTRVACFNLHPHIDPLSPTLLRNTIAEKFALRLFDNPKVHAFVDDKMVTIPQWIQDHPPQVMAVSKDKSHPFEIRGHIWADEKGNGRINVYQDGYLVEALQIDARKCKGYVEYNEPPTNNSRTAFVPSPQLTELKQWLRKELALHFDKTDVPTIDKREKDTAISVATAILGKYFNNTTYPGPIRDQPTKIFSTTTDPKGKDIVGYVVNPEPTKQEPKGPNVNPTTPNPDNAQKVGEGLGEQHGGAMIKIQSTKEKGPRRETRPFEYTEQKLGPDKPLWNIQKGSGIKGFTLIIVNTDNAEYPMYKGLPGGQAKLLLMCMWLSEIDQNESGYTHNGLPDHYRMKNSRFRVNAWNAYNLFPKPISDKQLMNPRARKYL